jgi:hypothetical protein
MYQNQNDGMDLIDSIIRLSYDEDIVVYLSPSLHHR